jgi:hypothetical protein
MQHIRSRRPALALLALAALSLLLAARTHPAGATTAVTVRVEGPTHTLIATTSVSLRSAAVVKDGVASHSCPGRSAAGALEAATAGRWGGTWSASYHDYLLTTIAGVTFASSGAEYWAFWVNDAPASVGICAYDPKPGDSLLFFPDCFGKHCPKSAGVLGIAAAPTAVVGRPFSVSVTAYSDAKGTPGKAAGVTVSGGGASAKTNAGGTAELAFAHAGRFTLSATKPDAIRAEARVCVEAAGTSTCG